MVLSAAAVTRLKNALFIPHHHHHHRLTSRSATFEFTTMPSIPVDVLREILGYVRKSDLATLCRVSKIFCSCSRDVLYRNIHCRRRGKRVISTLARSTDLARRVRSFEVMLSSSKLGTVLKNMSSLRNLSLGFFDVSILDGCTFKLDSFNCDIPNSESLQKFLKSQPSITDLTLFSEYDPFPPFDQRCLPNLTIVNAEYSWLGVLMPGRPVREVRMFTTANLHSTDLSYLALSTTPIQKLLIDDHMLCPKPVSLLVSIFPSLVHLFMNANVVQWGERVRLCLFIY
jgi:F-box-like